MLSTVVSNGLPRNIISADDKPSFLPTSLVSSIIRLLLELYLGARVLILLWSHKRLFDDDICVSRPLARVLSLFVFDMMTVVPDAKTTSVQAQFIPFSIGTILVIGKRFLFTESIE